MPLDPQVRAFLDKLVRLGTPEIHTLPPVEARALTLPIRIPRDPLESVRNRLIPGPAGNLPIRIYHPVRPENDSGRPLPALVYFHGGGWVIGSIASHDALCRRLCHQSGGVVVSVEYRLAPEHKYPAALDDCWAATQWVAEHAGELGADQSRIAVGGDSAGGNLAAVICLRARDAGGPKLAAQLLVYPITDYLLDNNSYRDNAQGYFLTREMIAWFWEQYLSHPDEGADVHVSPLRSRDFSGLPAAIILVAEFDPLRDEGLAYADRLEAAGVAVHRIVAPGQIHGFARRLDLFDSASVAVRALADALREQLRP